MTTPRVCRPQDGPWLEEQDEMGAHHMRAKDQTLTLKSSLTQGDEMARAVNT
jgi:hypothetical protein